MPAISKNFYPQQDEKSLRRATGGAVGQGNCLTWPKGKPIPRILKDLSCKDTVKEDKKTVVNVSGLHIILTHQSWLICRVSGFHKSHYARSKLITL